MHASARSSRRGQGHQGATTRRGGRGADQGGAHRDADLGGDRGDRRPTATQARAPCLTTSLVSMHGPLGPRTAGASANAPPCSKARDQRRGVSVPAPVAAATSTPLAAGRQQAHTSLAARHDVTRPRGTTTPSPTPTTAPALVALGQRHPECDRDRPARVQRERLGRATGTIPVRAITLATPSSPTGHLSQRSPRQW